MPPDAASPTLTAIVLTFNEEIHLERCLGRLAALTDRVVVIDSFSTDRTVEIARAMGAEVLQHEYVSHSAQVQWALDTIGQASDWIIKVDADEYLEPPLIEEIKRTLAGLPDEVTALDVKLKVLFKGKFIRWGGYYTNWLTRLWRAGCVKLETRWMDEKILLTRGRSQRLTSADLVDYNLRDIGWWTAKHNGYATLNMIDFIANEHGVLGRGESGLTDYARRRRNLRRMYGRAPLYLRAVAYYFHRYFIRLGFLDGRLGFVWHFMHGFWYFMLMDTKIDEARIWIAAHSIEEFPRYLEERYGIVEKAIAWGE